MSHGHDDPGHGHGAAPAGSAAHGPVEIPGEPAIRTISPAGTDLPFTLPGVGILWPVVWLGIAAVLFGGAQRTEGEIETVHGAHAPAEPGAPAHGTPKHDAPKHDAAPHGEK